MCEAPCISLAIPKPKIIDSIEIKNSVTCILIFLKKNRLKGKRDRTITCRSCQDSGHIDIVRNGSAEGFDLT